MKRLVLAVMILHLTAQAQADDTYSSRRSLHCGDASFVSYTIHEGLSVVRQRIFASRREGKARPLDLREHRVFQRAYDYTGSVLDSWVEGWACRTVGSNRFVELLYICNTDMTAIQASKSCPVTNEWDRYVDLSGALLDRGFAREDPRYASLRRSLGFHDPPPDVAFDDGPIQSAD